jgi:hypothetical protein
MSFLREAAVDLIIALQKHGIPKEIEIQFSRLCQECTRSAETETAMLKRKHSCPEWDYMVIDEDSPEFEACLCFAEPQKEWVGLSEPDIYQLIGIEDEFDFAKAIEAKLKEKNSV